MSEANADDEFGEEGHTRVILPTEDDNDGADESGYQRTVSCEYCDADLGSITDDDRLQYAEYRFVCEECGEPTVIEATPPEEPDPDAD